MNSEAPRSASRGSFLDLVFEDRENGMCEVRATSSGLAEAGPLEFSLGSLLDLGADFDPETSQSNDLTREIGQRLFRIIFAKDLRDLLIKSRPSPTRGGGSLRIVLRFRPDSPLLDVPWEVLHDGREFLALDQSTPIVRALRSCNEAYPLTASPPLRVLFTTACSILPGPPEMVGTIGPLQLDEEEKALREAEADSGGLLRVDIARGSREKPMTRRRLQHLFQRARCQGASYHLWHHSGHGKQLERKGRKEFYLLLDTAGAQPEPVPPDFISRWITGPHDLRVAVLNLCHGASEMGLGRRLAEFDVPAVIAMRTGVVDPAAATFAESFYKDLPTSPLDHAVTSGRQAMIDDKWPIEWAQPILFCKTREPLNLMPTKSPAVKEVLSSAGAPVFHNEGFRVGNMTQVVPSGDVGRHNQTIFHNRTFRVDELTQLAGCELRTEFEVLRQHLATVAGKRR